MVKKGQRTPRWSYEDRRRFADGVRERAQTVPAKDRPAPSTDEWDDDPDWKELES